MMYDKRYIDTAYKQGKDLVVLKRTPALHDLFLESASHGYDSYTMHIPRMYGVGFYAFYEKYKNDHDFLEDDRIRSVFNINVSDGEYFYPSFYDMRNIIFDEDIESRFDVCSFYLKMIDLLFEKYNTKEIKQFLNSIFHDFCELMILESDFVDEYCNKILRIEIPTESDNISDFRSNLIKFIKSSYLNQNNYGYMVDEDIDFNGNRYEFVQEQFYRKLHNDEDGWYSISVSDFCRNLEPYPSEIVMESWAISTRSAGVYYYFSKRDTWNERHGYQSRGQERLVVFLIINAKLINDKFVSSVSYIPEFEKEENLPKGLACVDNFTDLNEILGEERVESSVEALNNLGIRPKRGIDKLISAYISDEEIIGWIWVKKQVNYNFKGGPSDKRIKVELPAEYSFDVVILPKYSGLGLGKKLICDALIYIVNDSMEDEKKGRAKGTLKVNVISPYLIRYLRKLGFDLAIEPNSSSTPIQYLVADLNDSEQIEKILSNCR